MGNIIYEAEKIGTNPATSKTRILIDGGYIENGVYHFYLTDHLGNNRVVAKADGTVIQRNHYYPFGMAFAESTNEKAQPYKYNGKELDQMHQLNLYDSDARSYDAVIPRTPTPDPHAENYYAWSPYAWVGNNPMLVTDPTGMDWYRSKDGTAMMWREGSDATYTQTIKGDEGSVTIEYEKIGATYNQRVDEYTFIHYDQNKATVYYYPEDFKQNDAQYNQGALFGPDASGWSFNMEVTVGGSFETAVINAVTFNVGPNQGETYYYQVKGTGGGALDANVSLNTISYYYGGDKSNFNNKSLLGNAVEFSGSLGPVSGNWAVGAPDQYGARVLSQTYGVGVGLSPVNIGIRKTKTIGGWKKE